MSSIAQQNPTTSPTDNLVAKPTERLASLDAFRGATMLLMASAGLGMAQLAAAHTDNALLRELAFQTEHVAWRGCSLWDLIQPAFMFMVGVAVPWSTANRTARGDSFARQFAHALLRSLLLILLAVFLSSAYDKRTDWVFVNVLAQIGLGYPFLFLAAFTGRWGPWIAAGAILLGYWAWFAATPILDDVFTGLIKQAEPEPFAGFAAHWNKYVNVAAEFDRWFLNLFPRGEPHVINKGGYQTLNFVPSLATMLFGLLTGRLLRGPLLLDAKLLRLIAAGVVGIALGWTLDAVGVCPLVKRIWTPSWALFSTGWVLLILAGFLAVIDRTGWKRSAFPLIVVGLNPITVYCLFQLMSGFIKQQTKIHLGQEIFFSFGAAWTAFLERGAVLLVLWLIAFWMWWRKIFVRL
ncbi:MAG: DUF5009 domain-containing protein [Pirellulales bacterium]